MDGYAPIGDFEAGQGSVRLLDFFSMRRGGRERPRRALVRIAQCTRELLGNFPQGLTHLARIAAALVLAQG